MRYNTNKETNMKQINQAVSFLFSVAMTVTPSMSFAQDSGAQGPTDPEIAHIVVTANTIDVEAGELARAKAKDQKVKDFAKLMVDDHKAVNKQATDLAKKLGVTPKDNEVSKSLLSGAKDNLKKLKGLKGTEFEKAYVNNEVTYHQAVLDALDKTLIPNAKNEELKALMVKVRPAFVAHLEHAKGVQSALSK
jgi:putative membrane protein